MAGSDNGMEQMFNMWQEGQNAFFGAQKEMADTFAKAGRNAKAREYLNKIIDKYGDTDWAAKARARLAEIPAR